MFTQFPREETDEVRVFETISSTDESRHGIPEDEFEELKSFTNELESPSTWQNDILSRTSGDSDVVTDIKQLCRQLAEEQNEIGEKATEIVELLGNHEMSDWAENQLRTLYRRRRRYGTEGTINRLHHKLTKEIELVDSETVVEAEVALSGYLNESG
jgi:hypothetical protein